MCAAFRGYYLDYKERADTWLKTEATAYPEITGRYIHTYIWNSDTDVHNIWGLLHADCSLSASAVSTGGGKGVQSHCGWPLRNSKVFHAMNAVMERCNDLMELVHTIHDFR